MLRVQYLGVRFDPDEFRRDLLSLLKRRGPVLREPWSPVYALRKRRLRQVDKSAAVFGPAVGDERSTFVIEDREHDLVCRPLSKPRVLMQFRDDLATENPQVIAVRSQGFARRA